MKNLGIFQCERSSALVEFSCIKMFIVGRRMCSSATRLLTLMHVKHTIP